MEPSELAPLNRVGVWTFALGGLPFPMLREAAAEIEELGYGSLWFPESPAGEPFVASSLVLASTSTLIAGTGIASIWLRHPATMNATARGLGRAFPGRFLLGLGVSHALMVDTLFPDQYAKPVALMRKYLDDMDAVPMGREPPRERPPRVLAALGDKMLELARDRADGAHPYNATAEHTAHARAVLGPDKLLVPEQAVVLSSDRSEVRARARAHLSTYLLLENYRNNWLRLGFTEDDFADGGSERLCDALVVGGDAEAIRRRVADHLQAGADHVLIQALGEGRTVPLDQWRELGPALQFD